MYLAFGADMDVTFNGSGSNYDGVNVPFALGYTYHSTFTADPSWNFSDASIYGPPFFKGAGFIGVKYLKSPEVNGQQVGLSLFGATTNGGEFSDPRNTQALYRYLAGTPDPSLGDDQCNVGNVSVTKICYINQGAPADMRFFQSSGPLTLAPGEYSSIAVAYIFAAPVASGACTGPDVCGQVTPQAPTLDLSRLTQPGVLSSGANTVDSITGFRGWRDTTFSRKTAAGTDTTITANGIVDQEEFIVVPNSLLGKALTAQQVFDGKFSQPRPPTAPDYYLIPGAEKVTVVWRPSATEQAGDPFFQGTSDPNYREFDVAGYRVYRGSRGDASSLRLLAQYDKTGDTWTDRTGQINQIDGEGVTECSPFDNVYVSCTSAGTNPQGVPLIDGIDNVLDGPVIQNQVTRVSASAGNTRAVVVKADTAVTGGGSGRPQLSGNGVPFIFVDSAGNCERCGVRNHTRYFYIVTAFDINSIRSGPSSLESNLSGAKSVVPTPVASNNASRGSLGELTFVGTNGLVTPPPVPTVDAAGRFSGPFPPANGASLAFIGGLPEQLFNSPGTVSAELRSLTLGDARNGVPATYSFHFTAATGDTANLTFSIQQQLDGSVASVQTPPTVFAQPNAALLARYGLPADTRAVGQIVAGIPSYQPSVAWGRACVDDIVPNRPSTSNCNRNGPRWFEGANESLADPAAGNTGPTTTNFNNAGQLTGVTTVYSPHSYINVDADWRAIEATLGGAIRAADFELTWGASGKIASVVDLTHDVPVPFDASELGGGFAVLTQQGSNAVGSFDQRPGVLTLADFGCVEPFRSGGLPGWGALACSGGVFPVSDSVTLGPIAIHNGVVANTRTAAVRANQGFALYLSGHLFMFELTGNALPASGTKWKLRSYTGTIIHNPTTGVYNFRADVRPFTAIGSKMQIAYSAVNDLAAATKRDLRSIHTVPDPYYVTNSLEASADAKIIKFVNLPDRAIIRIYTVSGVLVRALEHNSSTSSEAVWDVRNRNGQFVASGVYFYHIEALDARRVGRMTIVNFAK
jgi:hypothetical protein